MSPQPSKFRTNTSWFNTTTAVNNPDTFELLKKLSKNSYDNFKYMPHCVHLEKRCYENALESIKYSAVAMTENQEIRIYVTLEQYNYLKSEYCLPESKEYGEIDTRILENPQGYWDCEEKNRPKHINPIFQIDIL
jgi:hypothetical protein